MNEKHSPDGANCSPLHMQKRVEKKTDGRTIIFYSFADSINRTKPSLEDLDAKQAPSEARNTDVNDMGAQ